MAEKTLGLRTVIYKVSDLDKAKAWYTAAFGVSPYYDQPYYVGFDIGGFELGLDPDVSESSPGPGGSVAYWRVANIDTSLADFTKNGATARSPASDVGGGIRVASVGDPFGNVIGLIEDPNYKGPKA